MKGTPHQWMKKINSFLVICIYHKEQSDFAKKVGMPGVIAHGMLIMGF